MKSSSSGWKSGRDREKLVFLDAELVRIEEQVELIREQAVMASEPHAVSERIDQIAATLGGTQQWIRDQQQILGDGRGADPDRTVRRGPVRCE